YVYKRQPPAAAPPPAEPPAGSGGDGGTAGGDAGPGDGGPGRPSVGGDDPGAPAQERQPELVRAAAAVQPGLPALPRPKPVRWPASSVVGRAIATGQPQLVALPGRPAPPGGDAADGATPTPGLTVQSLSTAAADEVRWPARAGAHTVAAAPVLRGGRPVGAILLVAAGDRPPLTEDDLLVAAELAARAAEAGDRAELAATSAPGSGGLRRRIGPSRVPQPAGLAVAARHQQGAGERGWDWYDVVDLGAGRAALVIGHVAASGELAAAALSALRVALRACTRLDLPPHEVISVLDGVLADVLDERRQVGAGTDELPDHLATCIYAVVETDSGRVMLASAGHPPPLVVAPDGLVSRLYMEVGPPLGTRRDDVKEYLVRLGPEWLLALFTDGLVGAGGREVDAGVSRLAGALARPGAALSELAEAAFLTLSTADDPASMFGGPGPASAWGELVAPLIPLAAPPAARSAAPGGDAEPTPDAALLLARLPAALARGLPAVEISVDGGAADLAPARATARAALAEWGLAEETLETSVLVLSELIANAVAHGRAPIDARVRRLGERVIVEVADGGGRLPRRRHAGADEEAGRGLELVATLADRWGTRPTADGKVVWAEIPLTVD
ncbi:MAG: SpoIIE family protein phosphatase, partial [Frankia sp.]|nr:SpoIIE family protein phosphatase [Frankia sp.]